MSLEQCHKENEQHNTPKEATVSQGDISSSQSINDEEQTTLSPSNISTNTQATPDAYYERFLRRMHPEYDDQTVRRKVETAVNDKAFRRLIQISIEQERRLKAIDPDWKWPDQLDW